MTASSSSNGNHSVAAIETLELIQNADSLETKVKSKRATTPRKNKSVLHLDAGSSNTKFSLDGYTESYEGIFNQLPGELPSGYLGCFSYKGKNYAVGQSAKALTGVIHEAYQNQNKIKALEIWLIGALTHHPDFLRKLAEKRRSKTKPVKVSLELKLLSLSSSKKDEIAKKLTNIGNFNFEGITYEIEITNPDRCIYPEGFGAALVAKQLVKSNERQFYILDLGGGTLTATAYNCSGERPAAFAQNSASGGGIKSVLMFLSRTAQKGDSGGNTYEKSRLQAALEISTVTEEGRYFVPYAHGQDDIDLGDALLAALNDWVRENQGVAAILTECRQHLMRGKRIFCTGGGFAIPAVKDFIVAKYLGLNSLVTVLDSPEHINLTGLSA